MKALSDVKVVEYAEFISGPMCAKLFADMGAEVIKIEPPGSGDEARRHPPFPGDIPHPEKSGLFLYLNTSKKGVTLNPAHPTGAAMFKELVREADILIENYPPGHMARLGLDYETLSALNQRLIMVSLSPFGQTGPYKDWKGPDLITWAMSLTGYNTPAMVTDPEKENPLRAPGRQADMMGATTAATVTMAALLHREATGQGQWIDVPCWQSVVNMAKTEMAIHSYTGTPFTRLRERSQARYEPSASRDGYIYTLWIIDSHFEALRELLGQPEGLESELFKTWPGRMHNDDVVRMLLQQAFLRYDTEYLVREGQRLGVPIGPVYTVAQAARHPHLRAREAFTEIDHPVAGRYSYPRALVKLSETPAAPSRAPLLGEHNDEVFGGRLGYRKADLIAMHGAGII